MAVSLPGMFVIASSYLVHGLQLFNRKREVHLILHTYQILKTHNKYCNFDNLPNNFIVIFKRLTTGDRCMAHILWTVSRRCYDRICTLYIHSISENEVINEE